MLYTTSFKNAQVDLSWLRKNNHPCPHEYVFGKCGVRFYAICLPDLKGQSVVGNRKCFITGVK